MSREDGVGRRGFLQGVAALAGAGLSGPAAGQDDIPGNETDEIEPVEDYVDEEAITSGEEIDLDDVHMEMLYFGEDSEVSHGVTITYPQPFYDAADPDIESVGLYGLSIDDFAGEASIDPDAVERQPFSHPQDRVITLLSNDVYQGIIDGSDYAVAKLSPETGDNVYGVFDMDRIDLADEYDPELGPASNYALDDHEIIRTPTPHGAVTKYLSAIGER